MAATDRVVPTKLPGKVVLLLGRSRARGEREREREEIQRKIVRQSAEKEDKE